MKIFLLTCLLRGMTFRMFPPTIRRWISTHMPLARHDQNQQALCNILTHFYSHASCEAWHERDEFTNYFANFYSHASCEAWHLSRHHASFFLQISTHMPLARHDHPWITRIQTRTHFYSHASCEAWHLLRMRKKTRFYFYSHASCEAWRGLNSSA